MKVLTTIALYATLIGVGLGLTKGCNEFWNSRKIERLAYTFVSETNGISGHTEFTQYADGTSDIKEYSGWGHRYMDSKLFQELNGDSLVDRIRIQGSEFKMHKLDDLLVRNQDYNTHKSDFDEADSLLVNLKHKYSK